MRTSTRHSGYVCNNCRKAGEAAICKDPSVGVDVVIDDCRILSPNVTSVIR
jgi:hypothetical protein